MPPVEHQDLDPRDRDPRERGLRRRSSGSAFNPWVLVLLLILLGVAFYIGLAVL